MIVKIQKCFKTSVGIIVIFGTPINFIPEINMRLENGENEIWEVKSISFNEYKGVDVIKDPSFVYRSYQIVEIQSERNKDVNLSEYFVKYSWTVTTSGSV